MAKKIRLSKRASTLADDFLKKIDLRPLLRSLPTRLIAHLPDSEKARLLEWVEQVRKVKLSGLSASEKRKQLERLPVPELILDLLKNYFADLVEQKSNTSHETAKTVLDAATQATRFVGKRTFLVLTTVGFGLHKLLPRLILTEPFDPFLDRIEKILKQGDSA